MVKSSPSGSDMDINDKIMACLCTFLVCTLGAVTGSYVCSKNVVARYETNASLITTDLAYQTAAMAEGSCRDECLSTDLCQFMWWASDGVCRLYNYNATGETTQNDGHVTLTKHCGECQQVFDRYDNSTLNLTELTSATGEHSETSCIELCINEGSCTATALAGSQCYLITQQVDTNDLVTSSQFNTYIPVCARSVYGETSTELSTREDTQYITTESYRTTEPTTRTIEPTTRPLEPTTRPLEPTTGIEKPTTRTAEPTSRDTETSVSTVDPEGSTTEHGLSTEVVISNTETLLQGTVSAARDTTTDMSTFSTQERGETGNHQAVTSMTTSGKGDAVVENQYVMCPEPYTPRHTTLISPNRRHYVWSVIIMVCSSPRYVFVEGGRQRSLVCLPTAQWHVNITKGCVAINSCDATDGDDQSADVKYPVDTVRRRQCTKQGRLPNGLSAGHIVCLSNGEWFGSHGTCEVDRCLPLPWLQNATMDVTAYDKLTDYNSRQNATCRRGYRFTDGTRYKVTECTDKGTWTETGDCMIEVCPALATPKNAVLSTTLSVYGTRVKMTCLPGYKLTNNETFIEALCLGRDGWTANISDCIAITCSSPVDVSDAWRDGDRSFYLANVTYQCKDNLTFADGHRTKTITCLGSGQWSERNFSCRADCCPPVPELSTAVPSTTNAVEGTTVVYSCKLGYLLPGGNRDQTISCRSKAWRDIEALSECVKNNCTSLDPVRGHFTTNSTNDSGVEVGSRVLVTCHQGYVFSGGATSKAFECLLNGSWSVNYSCKPVECDSPPILRHARMVSASSEAYNDTVTYYCLDGYWFSHNVYVHVVRCQADGTWSYSPRCCTEIRCPPLSLFDNLIASSSDVSLHSDVNVSCSNSPDDGSDVITVTCRTNGEWYPTPPVCKSEDSKKFHLEPEEASYSQAFGTAVLLTIAVLSVVIVISDAGLLYRQCRGNFSTDNRKHRHRQA